jgi:tetratricopeptide (TPR) repeat protein
VTTGTLEAQYTLKRIQEMLGLSRTVVAGLISAGFVTPTRGRGREHRFSFQDLMLLRTAYELQQASIPPRKILRSLSKLRSELPEELPLTGLRITAVGADVAVRDRSGSWQADSGQLLMDFEVADVEGTVSFLRGPAHPPGQSAHDWFARGASLESSDPALAEDAYRHAIELDPSLSDAYLNLGAMLCESGRSLDAVALYAEAFQHVKSEPRIYFNHAIALEDQKRLEDARAAYEHALTLDVTFADAHYNVGVLLEKFGDAQGALRHFSAYRRLRRGS